MTQTEGAELPEFSRIEGDPGDKVQKLEAVVRNHGIELVYEQHLGGADGRSEGGKIVLMSSARGLLGHPAGYTAYCASKSAVDGITRALGCELGGTGITVNAIAPTVFRSPLTAWMFEDTEKAREVRKGFLARVPKGRLGEPADLAGPLLFLVSRASDFYTGHILYADGGYTAG